MAKATKIDQIAMFLTHYTRDEVLQGLRKWRGRNYEVPPENTPQKKPRPETKICPECGKNTLVTQCWGMYCDDDLCEYYQYSTKKIEREKELTRLREARIIRKRALPKKR